MRYRAGAITAAERAARVELWNRRADAATDSLITYRWDGQRALMPLSAPGVRTTITRYPHDLFDALWRVRPAKRPITGAG